MGRRGPTCLGNLFDSERGDDRPLQIWYAVYLSDIPLVPPVTTSARGDAFSALLFLLAAGRDPRFCHRSEFLLHFCFVGWRPRKKHAKQWESIQVP